MSNKIFYFVCALIIIMRAGVSQAQVPQLINYQGVITDSEGAPINGPASILFSIYDDSTSGTLLWSETQTVTITDGIFSVLLGSGTPIPYSVFDDSLTYLELTVESDQPMIPRKRLVSVGYSFRAYDSEKLGGKDYSTFVRSVDGVFPDTSGNINLTSGGDDWGRPGVAANLYEGTTLLRDKYVNQTGPEEMTGNSSDPILTVNQNGSGYGVYGEHISSGNYGLIGSSSISVYGNSKSGYAGYFNGMVEIAGYFRVRDYTEFLRHILVNTAGSAASPAIQLNDNNTGFFDAGQNAIGFTTGGTEKMRIIGDKVGIGRTNPAYPLHMGSGARCTAGGVWTNASSMKYKENIADLSLEKATEALEELNPVTFNYKVDASETCVGFIAEDVPDLVATQDREGLSPMDIVAVLTKVVQEQQNQIKALKAEIFDLKAKVNY